MTKTLALWIIQGLLALMFLFAGGVKIVMPGDALTKDTPMLSAAFLRFVGVCEVLGAIGLILPPLAAAGLIVIMIGAIVVTLMIGGGATALFPFATGLLLAFVVYGRWRAASLASS